jgi:cell division inhibitor SepF
MSTLHKVKAYFGMAPMEDYDDEYYEDDDRSPARGYSRRGREDRFDDDGYGRGYDDREYDEPAGYRGSYDEPRFDPRLRGPREFDRPPVPRLGGLRGSTRGALAMDPRRMAELFEAGSPLSKITTLRPKDYSEARTIGEHFRDGTPVIMDLVTMDNADAKRLVDFAAGLIFCCRGSIERITTKVFLVCPPNVTVAAEEKEKIAADGFYNQS